MTMRILPILIAALLLGSGPVHAAGPAPAQAQPQPAAPPEKMFNAETFTLPNGMKVVIVPNHRIPVATQMIWYKVGSADEDRGESGIAHFVEHLMFKGSQNVPPGEFSTRVKAMGGDDNAFTSQDYTAYFETVTVDHLPEIMAMEADRMRGLLFPPDHVKSERNVVLEERRQRTENDPRGYFGEQMQALLFVNHPYGSPVGGWFNEVDALTRDNVMAFYKKWYAPNNAILVISGDVTAAKLKSPIMRTFGAVPAKPVPVRNWTKVPPMIALPRLVMRNPDIEQPEFQRVYRMPSLRQNHQDAMALEVMQDILSGGATARLYKTLVVEQKLATSIGLDYEPLSYSDGSLWISATPAEGVSLDKLEAAIDEQLKKLVSDGVTEAEMKDARARMMDAAVLARDSIKGPAMLFGQTLAAGGTMEDVENWPQQVNAVTAAQIQDVAKRFLDSGNIDRRPYITGIMLPADDNAALKGQAAPAPVSRPHSGVMQ